MEIECKWCGTLFTRTHNRQVYCSEECAIEGERENTRNRKLRWWYRNRERLYETELGTRSLGAHPNEDPEKEYQIIQRELKRLGLTES